MKCKLFLTLAGLLCGCHHAQPPAQTAAPSKPAPDPARQTLKAAPKLKGTLVYCTLGLPEVIPDPFNVSRTPSPEADHDHWDEKSRKPFDAEKFRAVITERKRNGVADSWIANGFEGAAVCLDARGTPIAMVVKMNEPNAYEIIETPTRSKNGQFIGTSEMNITHVKDNGTLASLWD